MCPTIEQWYDYKHGLIDGPAQTAMERHKAQCGHCHAMLEDLTRASELLDNFAQWPDFPEERDLAPTTGCLDTQCLMDSLTHALSTSKLNGVYTHLSACPRCRKEWMLLSDLLQAAQSEDTPIPDLSMHRQCFDRALAETVPVVSEPLPRSAASPWFSAAARSWFFKLAVVLAFFLAIGFPLRSVYVAHEVRQLVDQGNKDLYASLEGIRYDDLRLSGDFAWVPRQTRGAEGERERSRMEEAEKTLQRAWALRPEDPETNHALGRFYLAHREFDRAGPYLKKALASSPRSAPIQNDFGFLVYQQGEFSEAGRYFERAMELNPTFLAPVFNAAWLRLQQRRFQEAEALIQTYRRLDPSPSSYGLKDLQDELKRIRP